MNDKLYNLPSRDDIKYIEIENFKDYEFSSCLAYELAIRNEKVKKELECFSNYYKKQHTSYIQQLWEEDSNIEKGFDFTMLNEYGFNEDSIAYYFDTNHGDPSYQDKYNTGDLYQSINCNCIVDKHGKAIKIMKHGEYIHRYNNHPISDGMQISDIDDLGTTIKPLLSLSFSRPTLKIPSNNLTFSIDLNMNHSNKEILAYIKQIKEKYDEKNSNIESIAELLSGKFQETTVIGNTPKTNLQKSFANILYVYDYIKIVKKNNATNKRIYEKRIEEIDKLSFDGDSQAKEVAKGDAKNNRIDDKDSITVEKNILEEEIMHKKDTLNSPNIDKFLGIATKLIDNFQYKIYL